MARRNPGDVLSADWNPVIGCERCSPACERCWFLDGILPWQKRLGNIPKHVDGDAPCVFERRLSVEALKPKNGIIGVVQHGDLFWDRVNDELIHRVLDVVEATAAVKRTVPTYVLWTKRARRAADFLSLRYPDGLPDYLALAVSAEDQASADARFPELRRIQGDRIAVLEPLLGPVVMPGELYIDWLIVGSETGAGARSVDPRWVADLRDYAQERSIPFFVKQLGLSHVRPVRNLAGREWNEFPSGYWK